MAKFILMFFGFVFGAGVAFALELGLLFLISEISDSRFMPRGLGWVILPIFTGVAAAKITPQLPFLSKIAKDGLLQSFRVATPSIRFLIIAPLFWFVAAGLYVLIFEPYGYRPSSSDYEHMTKVMIFPPALFLAAYFTYIKLINPASKAPGDET